MIEAYRISVTRNIFDVSRTLAFEILNVFRLDRDTTGLILFVVRRFFLLIHLLVVEDYGQVIF